jgi:hypothetical protein
MEGRGRAPGPRILKAVTRPLAEVSAGLLPIPFGEIGLTSAGALGTFYVPFANPDPPAGARPGVRAPRMEIGREG